MDDLENRCVKYCYRVRLEQTARYAKEHGYDTFSTTLLISPYQNHNALKKIGEEMAEKYGLISYIETLDQALERDRQKLENLDCICKNIVDVYLVKR